jgi:Xaa-Pro aminopeptidase
MGMSIDFERRLVGLQEEMGEIGLDLAVFGASPNFQYLTGLLTDWRREIDLASGLDNVFVPREGRPILTLGGEHSGRSSQSWIKDVRIAEGKSGYQTLIEKVISDLDLSGHRVGLGNQVGSVVALMECLRTFEDLEFDGAESLMDDLRMIKDPEEIECLRKAAKLTDQVMEAVVPAIKEGITQRDLGLEVEFQGRRLGASDVSFQAGALFVKSGSEVSSNPFNYPKDKGLVSGTSIAFDFGFVTDGYCSDFGRSFYFGPASDEVKKGYRALQQGQLETVGKIHPGVTKARDLFPTMEEALDRLGYGDYLRARLTTGNMGHQIGIQVHENPWLVPESSEPLYPDMVMAIEPKIWHAGEYYLRVEDIVLIGPKKAEFLTNFDRELFEL